MSPASNFQTLSRTYDGMYGSGTGLGFALGGIEDANTNALFVDYPYVFNVPGMIVYNTSSQSWYNVSAKAISYYGTALLGATVYVDSFGPAGLLFLLGGTAPSGSQTESFNLNNISMYEPITQTWESQEASGEAPLAVRHACAVGVKGDNDTYEVRSSHDNAEAFKLTGQPIFFYGGLTLNNDIKSIVAMGVVYVLSLPSFHWQKQNYTPTYGRCQQSYNLVGNR